MSEAILDAFRHLEAYMTDLFERTERRFDAIDRRFDAIDRRFDAIDRRFDRIDARLDAIEQTLHKGFARATSDWN